MEQDFRLPAALSYLKGVIERYEELHRLYFEDYAEENKDDFVLDAQMFETNMPRFNIPDCEMRIPRCKKTTVIGHTQKQQGSKDKNGSKRTKGCGKVLMLKRA